MKLTNAKMTNKRANRIVGYAIGHRGVESEELKSLNDAIRKTQDLIIDIISKVDPDKIKIENTNDIYKLSNALSGLSRARVESEKVFLEMNGLVGLAGEKIIDEIRLGLADHPELMSQLEPIMAAAILKSDIRTETSAQVTAEEHKPNDDDLN